MVHNKYVQFLYAPPPAHMSCPSCTNRVPSVCSSILSYLYTMWATFNVCRGMGVRINGGTAERYMYKYLNPDLCLQRTSKGVSASFH
jgi:hypothetical protein